MIRYTDPFLRTVPLRRLLDRMLEDMASTQMYDQQNSQQQARTPEAQSIPVNIFQTPEQLVLVAPMPGANPADIEASVTGDMVYLRADMRGPHQEEKDYVVREWSYGPYERTVRLPCGVDAEKCNASFDNGLLVLNLPKRDVTRAHRVTLKSDASARGLREVRSGDIPSGGDGGGEKAQSTSNPPGAPAAEGSNPGSNGSETASSRSRKKNG